MLFAAGEAHVLNLTPQAMADMREFIVDLTSANSFEDFVAAFNAGFCLHVQGEWRGNNWDAFNDYLHWPDEEKYRLTFRGWEHSSAIDAWNRYLILDILKHNPHVQTAFT